MDSLVFLQLMLRSKRSLGRGSRIPPRTFGHGLFLVLEAKLASCWPYFPLLGRFWALLGRMLRFCLRFFAISSDFGPILDGLGRIWGEFGRDFALIFDVCTENTGFVKNSVLLRKNHYFQGIEA